jgi:hypothetical protein
MNVALRLLVLWFVASILFGILLGKALKVLGRQGSEEGSSLTNRGPFWMEEERQESLTLARSMQLE